MENYIVRIYRRSNCDPNEVVGQIECVESAETLPFKGMAELVEILSTPRADLPPNPVSLIGRKAKRLS